MNKRIYKGKSCVVRERTKLSDRGSYAGVIVGYNDEDKTVFVMNEDGIHTTVEHCIITDPVYIGQYYDEIKDEMLRLKKVMNDVLKSMHSSDTTMIKYCYNWTDYIVPTNIKAKHLDIPELSEKRLEILKKMTEVNTVKRNRLSKYESQFYYLERLADQIIETFRI